jgi:hypothetical protein
MPARRDSTLGSSTTQFSGGWIVSLRCNVCQRMYLNAEQVQEQVQTHTGVGWIRITHDGMVSVTEGRRRHFIVSRE